MKGVKAYKNEFELEIYGIRNGDEDLKIDLETLQELLEEFKPFEKG